jgi:toxin ParE1/3/4
VIVVWTEQALERLQDIEDFIAYNNPETAIRFIDKLIQRGEELVSFPESGRQVSELASNQIREVLEGNYRIVYRIKPDRLEILTIFEGHRQLPLEDISPPK